MSKKMEFLESDSKEKITLPPLDKSFKTQDKLNKLLQSPVLVDKTPQPFKGPVTELEKT